jgi:hypothetical protein
LLERKGFRLTAESDAATPSPHANSQREQQMAASPTFYAEFSDGQKTRMTVFTSRDKLDVERGVKLAQYAYESRTHRKPPAIVKARFESEGEILQSYVCVANELKPLPELGKGEPS